jgi:hypothetical protein
MAVDTTQAGNNINAEEYEQFLAEKARLIQARNDAESEFMFMTYDKLVALMKKRETAATRLNITLGNRADRELKKQKREAFKAAKSDDE